MSGTLEVTADTAGLGFLESVSVHYNEKTWSVVAPSWADRKIASSARQLCTKLQPPAVAVRQPQQYPALQSRETHDAACILALAADRAAGPDVDRARRPCLRHVTRVENALPAVKAMVVYGYGGELWVACHPPR